MNLITIDTSHPILWRSLKEDDILLYRQNLCNNAWLRAQQCYEPITRLAIQILGKGKPELHAKKERALKKPGQVNLSSIFRQLSRYQKTILENFRDCLNGKKQLTSKFIGSWNSNFSIRSKRAKSRRNSRQFQFLDKIILSI